MKYIYEMADIRICCDLPYKLNIQKESKEFVSEITDEEKEPGDGLWFEMKEVEMLPGDNWKKGILKEQRYFHIKGNEYEVYFSEMNGGEPYAYLSWDKESKKIIGYYRKDKLQEVIFSRNIWDMLGMETLLLRNHGLLLHASLIQYNEQGIAFSAPSGTGKSTQAELWKQYNKAEIINGDRAGIRHVDGEWYAYGLPYAGSSGIYCNKKVLLKAIIVLRQAKENSIRRLSTVEAMRYLYSEFSLHHWENDFLQTATEYMLDLLESIPVYLLECRPDRQAMEVTKQAVLEK